MVRITNEYVLSLSLLLFPSVFLSYSRSPLFIVLFHAQYPFPHFSVHVNICPFFFFSCFRLYKATSVEKRPFRFWGFAGATVLNCVLTVAPVSCRQAYTGGLKAHTGIWKAILVKELETIIVSAKCWEIQPVQDSKRVLTFVVLSEVPAGFTLVSAGLYRAGVTASRLLCASSWHLRLH